MARTGFVPVDATDLTAEHGLAIYRRRISKDTVAEILRRLEGGESGVSVARSLGIPVRLIYDTVWKQRMTRQIAVPDIPRPKDEFVVAQEMWVAGASRSQIADLYGYTMKRLDGVIQHYRKKFGWFAKRTKYPDSRKAR